PLVWAASAPVFVLAAAPLVLAPRASLAALAGLLPWAWVWTAPAYFCLFALAAGMFRRLVPEKVPAARWAPAFFLAPLVSLCCYAGTMFTNTMTWRGISYRVTWGGRVLEVRRPG
ncbi:MAG: hypothetical protein PHV85_08615, partial [Desulfovibrionaceae bacterium]|nr:hypothetical protein [Desulfovibrionaceae bacterium]